MLWLIDEKESENLQTMNSGLTLKPYTVVLKISIGLCLDRYATTKFHSIKGPNKDRFCVDLTWND